jgi:hypothetical protein
MDEANARPQNALAALLGQHWSIVGTTGSGKTRFALGLMEYLRRQYPHARRYILNSTGDDMAEVPAKQEHTGDSIPPLLSSSTYTQVWTPDSDPVDAYNAWLHRILYARKPAIVLIDEVASLSGDSKAPIALEGHTKLLKQGRKHGISVINGVQEFAKSPPSMWRQMTWFTQFRLANDPYEVSSARRFLNIAKDDHRQPHAQFGFHLRRLDGNFPAREYRSMQELFGHSIH